MKESAIKPKDNQEICRVLKEVEEAYNIYANNGGSMNADYAGFACIALDNFRIALDNPHLSCDDLQIMLRTGMKEHYKDRQSGKSDWQNFVASHIANIANENTQNIQNV
ncbi:MAG: hypothetical protein ACLFP8_02250 [Alphaproteobacteria bacterium]